MSRLESQDLLNEFFQEEKSNFPEVSYEQFKEVTYGPWKHLKTVFESGTLEEVRIKYFGNFLVHKGKAKAELEKLTKRFKAKTIVDKEYFRIKEMIETYLNKEE